MRRRPSHQPIITLTHPNDESITVTVQKPTRVQGIGIGLLFAKGTRAIEVSTGDGRPSLDAEGEPRVFLQHTIPLEAVIAGLQLNILGWSGITDEQGAPIAFAPDGSNVEILLEEFLDVAATEPIPEKDRKPDGPTTRPATYAFARWINEQIGTASTWSSDPKGNASAKS